MDNIKMGLDEVRWEVNVNWFSNMTSGRALAVAVLNFRVISQRERGRISCSTG
jgi:hypothetical protein